MKYRFSFTFFILSIVILCFLLYVPSLYSAEGIPDADKKQSQSFEGFLYFIDTDGKYLKAVEQKFSADLNNNELGLAILKALITGPALDEFGVTLPKGTKINAFFTTGDGKAFIDFDRNISTLRSYSAQTEMLTIYSIVNSIVLNIDGVERVKILIQGENAQTLSGHINLDCFYEANMLIVK